MHETFLQLFGFFLGNQGRIIISGISYQYIKSCMGVKLNAQFDLLTCLIALVLLQALPHNRFLNYSLLWKNDEVGPIYSSILRNRSICISERVLLFRRDMTMGYLATYLGVYIPKNFPHQAFCCP